MIDHSSKLLINESPLQVEPSLAKALGNINEAIILQQIQYWLNKSGEFHDGRKWVYNSVKNWQKQFPWLKENAISNRLNSLEKKKILITSNFNRLKFDRTKWYSINYDRLNAILKKNKSITHKEGNGTHRKDKKQVTESVGSQFTQSGEPIPIDYQKTTHKITKKEKEQVPYKKIITYLNQKTGKHYHYQTSSYQKLIKARWEDGNKLKDFKKVIDNKAADWRGTDYWQYMRPSTLFRASKFDEYLNETSNGSQQTEPNGGFDPRMMANLDGQNTGPAESNDDLPF